MYHILHIKNIIQVSFLLSYKCFNRKYRLKKSHFKTCLLLRVLTKELVNFFTIIPEKTHKSWFLLNFPL